MSQKIKVISIGSGKSSSQIEKILSDFIASEADHYVVNMVKTEDKFVFLFEKNAILADFAIGHHSDQRNY